MNNMTEMEDCDKVTPDKMDEKQIRTVKRRRADFDAENKPDSYDAGPVDKKPSFKLNPATLIHGVARPAPKDDTDIASSAPKRSFLRPSRLRATATVPISTQLATSTGNAAAALLLSTKPDSLENVLPILHGRVSSNNPFLKAVNQDDDDDCKNIESKVAVLNSGNENGTKEKQLPTLSSTENSFLQMTGDTAMSKSADSSNSAESPFIFGHKMEERVRKCDGETVADHAPEQKQEFVFGSNLSDRVKTTGPDPNTFQTAPAESAIFDNPLPSDTKPGHNGRGLEANAAVLFNASNIKYVMPEVEVKTGEEDEKNVLQVQCKLYQYDSNNSKNWIERGRGNLRLNDMRISAEDCKFQSRLVMRTNGSLRLILNTKIWASMVVEKANSRSVRISAQKEDGEIGVYLIMAATNDADHLFRAIEYRVLHLKQADEKIAQSKADNNETTRLSGSSSDTKLPDEKKELTTASSPISPCQQVTEPASLEQDDDGKITPINKTHNEVCKSTAPVEKEKSQGAASKTVDFKNGGLDEENRQN